MREINPNETTRATAFGLWLKAPNPMVTFTKTFDVMPIIKASKERGMKFNMLLDYLIGKAASTVKEFYMLPIGDKLYQFDNIAVNTIVANKEGEINSCDIAFSEDLKRFNDEYLKFTKEVCNNCSDRDLSGDHMVIGTSAIIDTEIDSVVGMNSGIFNNPFIVWGKYRLEGERALLNISFQFHHVQMDGAHAGKFLKNLEDEIENLR